LNTRFERLTFENLHHVATLHRVVYGKQLSMAYLRAKYRPMEPHTGLFGTLAFIENKPIGFIGIIPQKLEYHGKQEWTGFVVDAMTLPTHRSWVLFSKLIQSNHQMLSAAGFASLCTNSVPQTAILYNPRIGWTASHQLNAYKIPVMNRNLAYVRRKTLRFFNQNAQTIFRSFLSPATSFSSFESQDVVRVCRDESFLKYKEENGSFFATHKDGSIWLKQLGSLYIGEVMIRSNQEFESLMQWLIPLARKAGAPEIIFQTSPGSLTDACFAKKHTAFPSWTLGYFNLSSEFPLDKIRMTIGDFDTF
jgi:hypothetical protein